MTDSIKISSASTTRTTREAEKGIRTYNFHIEEALMNIVDRWEPSITRKEKIKYAIFLLDKAIQDGANKANVYLKTLPYKNHD